MSSSRKNLEQSLIDFYTLENLATIDDIDFLFNVTNNQIYAKTLTFAINHDCKKVSFLKQLRKKLYTYTYIFSNVKSYTIIFNFIEKKLKDNKKVLVILNDTYFNNAMVNKLFINKLLVYQNCKFIFFTKYVYKELDTSLDVLYFNNQQTAIHTNLWKSKK